MIEQLLVESFGKGLVQEQIKLNDNSVLRLPPKDIIPLQEDAYKNRIKNNLVEEFSTQPFIKQNLAERCMQVVASILI